MKATELMIGNWVYNTHNRQPEQVCETMEHMVMLAYNDLYDYDEIEPIPLTSDILEKNGFFLYNEEDKAYRLELAEGTFINADFKVEEPFVCIINTCYQATPYCVYVHHLQHAMRLCGIEMDFKV